ncbi:MAG: FecR family protein [Bacteroidales bacterium]|nr:FecR family protein [Bacteroidales bacterium]
MEDKRDRPSDELKRILDDENREDLLAAKLKSPEGQQELYREAFRFWNEIQADNEITDFDRAQILDRIHHQIKLEEKVFIKNLTKTEKFLSVCSKIAAILFIPLLITVGFLYNANFRNNAVEGYSEIYVPVGTRTSFVLPDGTKGWLNSGSYLRYPNRFSDESRLVELSGEGYFKVEKENHRPFMVKTKDISVRVYGTAFNVYAYPDGNSTEVVLEEGKVEILGEQGKTTRSLCYLKPNEKFVLNQETGSSHVVQVDPSCYTSWKNGKMVFRYETFKNVVEKLNRWYNSDIIIKDSILESYVYYGTFQDETLDEVLKLIKMTAPIKYRDFGRVQNPDGTFGKRRIELFYRKP